MLKEICCNVAVDNTKVLHFPKIPRSVFCNITIDLYYF